MQKIDTPANWQELKNGKWFDCCDKAFDYIKYIYNQSIENIRNDLDKYLTNKQKPDNLKPKSYPFIGFNIDISKICLDSSFSYGSIAIPGQYSTTLTNPCLFEQYYKEQISVIMQRHNAQIFVAHSNLEIPLPFALTDLNHSMEVDDMVELSHYFSMPDLNKIHDDIPNGMLNDNLNGCDRPLSLFDAQRVDFSLHRIHHYTGTKPEYFQPFIMLTNYQRYVKEFISYAVDAVKNDPDAQCLIGPNDTVLVDKNGKKDQMLKQLPQMPAYHLIYNNKPGITLVNIGVGPSNAKTITDHIAVLRPHCWIMLGHCAGLRVTQNLGDYVLADGYVRKDNVLNDVLPTWIPIPPIAEVQQALQQAVFNTQTEGFKTKDQKEKILKTSVRTGTVYTTDNRNWEIQTSSFYEQFKQCRAIAVDMESATLAANGFRFRVPYGTLLCVSDKPIHGVIKLQGMANLFYQTRIKQHLKVGLEAIRILNQTDFEKLHSRKLRGFEECPFR